MIGSSILAGFMLFAPTAVIYVYKWLASYIWIKLFKKKRRFDLYDPVARNDPVKLGFIIPQLEKELESPLPESHLVLGTDEIFFYGTSSKSEYLITRISRGINGEAEAWLYLKLANGKTYYLTDKSGYQQPYTEKCSSFTCGGLIIQCLAPMRKWRIFYSGLIKEVSVDGNKTTEKMVFVKFAFIWTASSNIYDLTYDFCISTLVGAFAGTKWEFPYLIPPLKKFYDTIDFYTQSGVIIGTVNIEETDKSEIYLFGQRVRHFSKIKILKNTIFHQVLGTTPKNGLIFHIGRLSVPNILENLQFGFVVQPDSELKIIQKNNIVPNLLNDYNAKQISAYFRAENNYELNGTLINEPLIFENTQGWQGSIHFKRINFKINTYEGHGVAIWGKMINSEVRSASYLRKIPKIVPLVVDFLDESSYVVEIAGGKGSSLGKLIISIFFLMQNNGRLPLESEIKIIQPNLVKMIHLVARLLEYQFHHRIAHQCLFYFLPALLPHVPAQYQDYVPLTCMKFVTDFYTSKKSLNYLAEHIAVACIDLSLRCFNIRLFATESFPNTIAWQKACCSDITQEKIYDIIDDIFSVYD